MPDERAASRTRPASDLPHLLALLRVPKLGNSKARRLLQQQGSAAAVFAAGPTVWRAAGCTDELCTLLGRSDRAAAAADLSWLNAGENRDFIAFDDPRYPPQLAEIPQAPLGLFTLGDASLLCRAQIAIVGARAASTQGAENARAFARDLVRAGVTITSGLALGIDAAAHRAALDADGATIAVCGNGLDRIYPARNQALARDIAARGLLISEFAPGTAPKPEHFPRRNRVISGLSLGVLVIEAALESGSLITARLAADQGREVFALPGSIHNPLARGCHALIRDGAKLTETVDDIVMELIPLQKIIPVRAARGAELGTLVTDKVQARILAELGHESVALDQLVARLQVPVAEINAALLALELDGIVTAEPGERFMLLQRREN